MAVDEVGEYRLGTDASWDEYVVRLEMFYIANKITTDEQRRTVIVSCWGEAGYGLIVTLVKPIKLTPVSYDEVKRAVCKHLNPSELHASCLFYRRNQAADESVADYIDHCSAEDNRKLRFW
ncbi:hypothetical protein MRX96_004956 [Rhipicephalus microplus]